MVVAIVVVFILFFLLVLYSCLRVSSEAEKRAEYSYKQYMSKRRDEVLDKNKDLFCLATNKPVAVLDFKTMSGCEPEKCINCRMSTFIDLE